MGGRARACAVLAPVLKPAVRVSRRVGGGVEVAGVAGGVAEPPGARGLPLRDGPGPPLRRADRPLARGGAPDPLRPQLGPDGSARRGCAGGCSGATPGRAGRVRARGRGGDFFRF